MKLTARCSRTRCTRAGGLLSSAPRGWATAKEEPDGSSQRGWWSAAPRPDGGGVRDTTGPPGRRPQMMMTSISSRSTTLTRRERSRSSRRALAEHQPANNVRVYLDQRDTRSACGSRPDTRVLDAIWTKARKESDEYRSPARRWTTTPRDPRTASPVDRTAGRGSSVDGRAALLGPKKPSGCSRTDRSTARRVGTCGAVE